MAKDVKRKSAKKINYLRKKDLKFFNDKGAKAYLKDLPNAQLHLLDADHFAAEEKTIEIAKLILEFLAKNSIE